MTFLPLRRSRLQCGHTVTVSAPPMMFFPQWGQRQNLAAQTTMPKSIAMDRNTSAIFSGVPGVVKNSAHTPVPIAPARH